MAGQKKNFFIVILAFAISLCLFAFYIGFYYEFPKSASITSLISEQNQINCQHQLQQQDIVPHNLKEWNRHIRQDVIKVFDHYLSLGKDYGKDFSNLQIYDHLPLTYACSLNSITRVGNGDGGKWICNEYLPLDDCVAFSMGSNGDFSFEEQFYRHTQGKCKIFTFDCTGSWQTPSFLTFVPYCLSSKDFVDTEHGWQFKSWESIMKITKVKKVTYLKMDIEGSEWSLFPLILSLPDDQLPLQISFEFHLWPVRDHDLIPNVPEEYQPKSYDYNHFPTTIRLFKRFYERGYMLASREIRPNEDPVWGLEYVMVRPPQ